jgi:hypothetical protein
MPKWVIRRTVDGKAVSEAKICAESRPILKGTGVRAVDDYVHELLADGERLGSGRQRRPILLEDQLVGFIDVTDSHP